MVFSAVASLGQEMRDFGSRVNYFFESKSRRKANQHMRKKPAKIKTPSTKFKVMGEKQPQSAFTAWKKKYDERIEGQQKISFAMDGFPIPFDNSDLDDEFEKEILDGLDAVKANVERRARIDSDKDAKIAEQEAKIAEQGALIEKVQKRNDTLQDKLVGAQERRNSKKDVMGLVSDLFKEICEDEYPNPLRLKKIFKDDRLIKILDEKNCDLTIGRGREMKTTRRSKNINKLKDLVSISEHSVEEIIRRVNSNKYPKKALLGAPSRKEECRLQSKPNKKEPGQKMVSLKEEDWSSKSAPQIIKAPKDVDHDLN